MTRPAPRTYIELSGLPVPPTLEAAMGYEGGAPLVAFWWSPPGDALCLSDGVLQVCGANWSAWLDFVDHPYIARHLDTFDFGSSQFEGAHRLILDRRSRRLAVADRDTAERILLRQRRGLPPAPLDSGRLDFEQLMACLATGGNIPSIQARRVRYDRAQETMRRWLDALETP